MLPSRVSTLIGVVYAVTAATAFAQKSAMQDERTRNVVWCYELTLGVWATAGDSSVLPSHNPPARFLLDSVGRDQFPPEYHTVTPGSAPSPLNIDSWRWIDTARLLVTWSSNTLAGVRLDMHVVGDSLVGTASAFDEPVVSLRAYPTAHAVARRAVCRTPPPSFNHSAER